MPSISGGSCERKEWLWLTQSESDNADSLLGFQFPFEVIAATARSESPSDASSSSSTANAAATPTIANSTLHSSSAVTPNSAAAALDNSNSKRKRKLPQQYTKIYAQANSTLEASAPTEPMTTSTEPTTRKPATWKGDLITMNDDDHVCELCSIPLHSGDKARKSRKTRHSGLSRFKCDNDCKIAACIAQAADDTSTPPCQPLNPLPGPDFKSDWRMSGKNHPQDFHHELTSDTLLVDVPWHLMGSLIGLGRTKQFIPFSHISMVRRALTKLLNDAMESPQNPLPQKRLATFAIVIGADSGKKVRENLSETCHLISNNQWPFKLGDFAGRMGKVYPRRKKSVDALFGLSKVSKA